MYPTPRQNTCATTGHCTSNQRPENLLMLIDVFDHVMTKREVWNKINCVTWYVTNNHNPGSTIKPANTIILIDIPSAIKRSRIMTSRSRRQICFWFQWWLLWSKNSNNYSVLSKLLLISHKKWENWWSWRSTSDHHKKCDFESQNLDTHLWYWEGGCFFFLKVKTKIVKLEWIVR